MLSKTLEHVINIWDSDEHKIEYKLEALESYIFSHLGLNYENKYYETKGKLFHRYIAGFVHRYIGIIKEFSFIVLDPLHIFDIITGFAKGVFVHPIKTLKTIWECWTGTYKKGIYGFGAITADALLACFIAGASTVLVEGEVALATESAVEAFGEKAVSRVSSLPNKVIGVGNNVKNVLSSSEEFFDVIRSNPVKVLDDAKRSLVSGVSYGDIKKYKAYAKPFLAQHSHA